MISHVLQCVAAEIDKIIDPMAADNVRPLREAKLQRAAVVRSVVRATQNPPATRTRQRSRLRRRGAV